MGAGTLVDVFDPLDEGGEPIDGFASKLRDLRKRWDNRIVLERCSLAELYINGHLDVVLDLLPGIPSI